MTVTGTIEINMREVARDIRFAKLRTPREDGPLSRKGLHMLVGMSANELRTLGAGLNRLDTRRDVIDRINEGVRRGDFGRPDPADLNEVLDLDLLKARCELEEFRFDAEGGNLLVPWEAETVPTSR